MDLQQYVDDLQQQLGAAAEAGGQQARDLADRLTAPLETATRLVLLEALAAAAAEITRELAPSSVDVRLRGRNPEFVVTSPAPSADFDGGSDDSDARFPGVADGAEETGTSRVTLRLPEQLKSRIEEAAAREKLSVNSWLVRSVTASLDQAGPGSRPGARKPSSGRRYSGWVQ
ncbi:histidine kinase [Arthrobacter sp. H41]|uniref:histidine kinase n=1 Tax=Arthrobacter sp. H41 TaxID=1312978 RepID=UPI000478DA0A|nr:histidine kinase [Arthrobacter sp. H41]